MIVSLVAHMFSTMMLKAYRPPRELTWVTGFVLFAVALGFGFSGYLLPWNELSFFATAVGTDSVKAVPVVGHWILEVLRGGPDVTINTLYRFFALHAVVLPLTAIAIIAAHLLFIQRQGMAPPLQGKATRGLPFFPDFLLRDLLLWSCCLIALVLLVFLLPYGPGIPGMEWELGKKANPLAPAYPGIKPEWYFLWVYQLLKEFPPHLLGLEGPQAALAVVSALLLIWAVVPWIDRAAAAGRPSPAFSDFGVSALYVIGFLTLKAWDIGGGAQGGSGAPDPMAVARVCSLWSLGIIAGVSAFLLVVEHQRFFVFTGAVVLHVTIHGLFGVSYLLAATIALAMASAGIAVLRRPKGQRPSLGGAP